MINKEAKEISRDARRVNALLIAEIKESIDSYKKFKKEFIKTKDFGRAALCDFMIEQFSGLLKCRTEATVKIDRTVDDYWRHISEIKYKDDPTGTSNFFI